MDKHCELIMDEYRANKDTYEQIREIALNKLKENIKKAGFAVAALEGRVKEEKSLAGKLDLKGHKYKDISDITDIIGVRVVTFYSVEVDKIAAIAEQLFDIDWENSVDKRKMMASDQFGYLSLHYICNIPKRVYYDENNPLINEVKFELQMRTTLQHTWATAFHDTGYKSDIEVPAEYIRQLNRLAGLLEIADQQFSDIIKEIAAYRRKVRSLLKSRKYEDLELNGDTYNAYMNLGPFDKLNSRIAAINRAEISKVNDSKYLEIFKWLGFKTLADLEKLKDDYSDQAYSLANLQISGTDIDIISSTVGMQNLCIIYIIKQGWGTPGLKMFFDRLNGVKTRNLKSAERIMKQSELINLN